jgi:transglutaminase-like putative cysteine protease
MLVRPRPDGTHRTVFESRSLLPHLELREQRDGFGNLLWRFTAPVGDLTVRYDAVVEVEPSADPVVPDAPVIPVDELPVEALGLTLPSRFVESDLLSDAAWRLFGGTPPTWQRVQAISDWVHANIAFGYGRSSPTKTALQVYESREGVCRDFMLLAIAFCRAVNIPARYCFGYMADIAVEPDPLPMDFHTWFEAYVGDRWYVFDPRHNVPRIGRILVGRGRDAADAALSTSYGSARLASFVVWADEVTAERPGGAPPQPDADAEEAAARAKQ